MTRIVVGRPPIYDRACAAFVVSPKTIFAWGDAIYVPPGSPPLERHLIVHEETHLAQQAAAGGPEAWWERYLVDDAWRLEQELEAYRRQYQVACQMIPRRPNRLQFLRAIAEDASGPLYGSLLTRSEAERRIRA